MAPYFIGLWLGLKIAQGKQMTLSKFQTMFGWILSLITLLLVVTLPYQWVHGQSYSKLTALLYDSLCRVVWSLALSWIVFICKCNVNHFIGLFLSWSAWTPLARLTYMTFLTHMHIVWWHSATQHQVLFTSTQTMVCFFKIYN